MGKALTITIEQAIAATRDMIKDVAAKAQIDVTGISGHSFRVGTAQTLVEKKATMPQLQTAGRWKDTRECRPDIRRKKNSLTGLSLPSWADNAHLEYNRQRLCP